MKRFVYCIVGLSFLASSTSCEEAEKLAGECGLTCPGQTGPDGVEIKGIAEGNAAISGVANVDAFFASVNNFRGAADGVSAGIEAELDRIRADFGMEANANVATELRARIMANVQGGVRIDYQPARCAVDAQATFEAQARCEAKVVPPNVELECKGECELEAGAELKCDASAELECDFTGPTVDCKGECTGTCDAKFDVAAMCDGTCKGECTGTCDAYATAEASNASCAGRCSGMCKGTCEMRAEAMVECKGTCRGECKLSGPDVDCMGSARASCKAKANASVMCKGKCEGDFTPPEASAECEASARAEAKLNVECTPPSIAINYQLKAVASADVMAQARFDAALKTLFKVRLPALIAASERAKSIASAGADLFDAAGVAVKSSIKLATDGDASIRAKAGLICAAGQLDDTEMVLDEAGMELQEKLDAAIAVRGVFDMT